MKIVFFSIAILYFFIEYSYLLANVQKIALFFSAIYLIYVLIKSIIANEEGAVIFLAGYIILFTSAINDMLHDQSIINTAFKVPIGVFIFIFSQAILLAKRFSKAFATVETLSLNLEKKVYERTLELSEANEQLKELDIAKTNFFSNISHEIRTPLTIILSTVESILQGDYQHVNTNTYESIHRNALRLLVLINSILDFSKIEAGKMTMRKEKTDVSHLISNYIAMIQSGVKSKGLDLEYINNAGNITILIDRDLFEKAVYNLISNAIKFTLPPGRIIIQLDIEDDNCVISVRDTGIGIPEDKLEVIFERFSQVDTSSSRKFEGTGIGLSLTKEIVELHGGSVSVESIPDQGSTFRIIILLEETLDDHTVGSSITDEIDPFLWHGIKDDKRSVSSLAEKSPMGDSDSKSNTLLIVDDNPDMIELLIKLLEKDYIIMSATDGNMALEILHTSRQKPDLLLSDVMMPNMDGYELTGRVRSDKRFEGLPIILVTAKADAPMRIEGITRGANDYIVKPFNPRELKARIKSQLDLKLLRDRLVQSNEHLKQILDDSSILVSDIGHRFQSELSPFSMLILTARTLLEEIEPEMEIDKEKIDLTKELLIQCEESLDRIEELKNKIKLNFGKKREKVYNKLVYVLNSVLNGFKKTFEQKNIQLETLIGMDKDEEIKINSEQIEIAIENILTNAMHALDTSGKKNKKIIVESTLSDGYFIIKIEDNGPGMPEDIKGKIFKMFFTTKGKEIDKGMGIGLYITRWIIEDCHKGTVSVESEEGEFTRFTIVLPGDGDTV